MFLPSTKVLVIDDMMTMRKVVKKNLKDLGFTDIQEAADGEQGWNIINTSSIQLVISDWNMPVCTGIELLKRVRSDARFAKLPFILLTAEAEMSQIMNAVSLGVSNYVVKPFTPESLKDKLEQTHKKNAA